MCCFECNTEYFYLKSIVTFALELVESSYIVIRTLRHKRHRLIASRTTTKPTAIIAGVKINLHARVLKYHLSSVRWK